MAGQVGEVARRATVERRQRRELPRDLALVGMSHALIVEARHTDRQWQWSVMSDTRHWERSGGEAGKPALHLGAERTTGTELAEHPNAAERDPMDQQVGRGQVELAAQLVRG